MTCASPTWPKALGVIERRVLSACCEVAPVPSPASGTKIFATSGPGYTFVLTGRPNSLFVFTEVSNEAIAERTDGAWMSLAFTTTIAGSGPPGNAALMWS